MKFCLYMLMSMFGLPVHTSIEYASHIQGRAALVEPSLTSSVISQESGWNWYAKSSAGAVGLMQLTPIAVEEVERVWNLKMFKLTTGGRLNEFDDLYLRMCKPIKDVNLLDEASNVYYGTCYLALMLVTYGTEELALISYNGGHRQAMNLIKGKAVAKESLDYAIRVRYYKTLFTKERCDI